MAHETPKRDRQGIAVRDPGTTSEIYRNRRYHGGDPGCGLDSDVSKFPLYGLGEEQFWSPNVCNNARSQ